MSRLIPEQKFTPIVERVSRKLLWPIARDEGMILLDRLEILTCYYSRFNVLEAQYSIHVHYLMSPWTRLDEFHGEACSVPEVSYMNNREGFTGRDVTLNDRIW